MLFHFLKAESPKWVEVQPGSLDPGLPEPSTEQVPSAALAVLGLGLLWVAGVTWFVSAPVPGARGALGLQGAWTGEGSWFRGEFGAWGAWPGRAR